MPWVLENTQDVPNTQQTRTCKLVGDKGYCILTGWIQGCGLNGLERLYALGSCGAEHWPEFRDFLSKVTTNLGKDGASWNTKRWMFTITDNQLAYPGGLVAEMIKASRLVDSFKNQSHGTQTIHMYFLEF